MGASPNRVAVITGAARGAGRSHAVALASREWTSSPSTGVPTSRRSPTHWPPRRIWPRPPTWFATPVGGFAPPWPTSATSVNYEAAVDAGVAEFGDVDVVIANAGVVGMGLTDPFDEGVFADIVDTNLRGVWNTIAATAPSMIRGGTGGSMVLISSMQGLVGRGGDGSAATFAYAASKHGVVGLMRSAAYAYAQQGIRVNSVHPTGVGTPMIFNDHMADLFAANPVASAMSGNLLPVPFIEPIDVTNAVLFLINDSARYLTGTALPVDAGFADDVMNTPVGHRRRGSNPLHAKPLP